MVVTHEAGSFVMLRGERWSQLPTYHVSIIFKNAEFPYSVKEKVGYTLLLAARRLWLYFQAHFVKVMTDLSLEKHLKKLEKSRWVLNWVVKLGEFNLQFTLVISMKGQALVYFIGECTISLMSEDQAAPEDNEDDWLWTIYINGSPNDCGSGEGVVMESHDGYFGEHCIKFGFKVSNNAVNMKQHLLGWT